jgi:hypothetical protein
MFNIKLIQRTTIFSQHQKSLHEKIEFFCFINMILVYLLLHSLKSEDQLNPNTFVTNMKQQVALQFFHLKSWTILTGNMFGFSSDTTIVVFFWRIFLWCETLSRDFWGFCHLPFITRQNSYNFNFGSLNDNINQMTYCIFFIFFLWEFLCKSLVGFE